MPETYRLTNTFAGGLLVVDLTSSGMQAQLSLFGSGAPVSWCIQSGMKPVW